MGNGRVQTPFFVFFLLVNGRATLGGVFLPFLGRRITCRVGRPPVVRLRRRRRRRSETSRARNAAHVIPVGTTRHARPPPCTRVLALAFFFLSVPAVVPRTSCCYAQKEALSCCHNPYVARAHASAGGAYRPRTKYSHLVLPPVFRRLRFGVSDSRRVADDLLGYVLCFCVCVEVCRLPRKTVLADEFVTRRRWRHLDKTGMCFVEFEDLFQAPQTALHLRFHLRYHSSRPGVLW